MGGWSYGVREVGVWPISVREEGGGRSRREVHILSFKGATGSYLEVLWLFSAMITNYSFHFLLFRMPKHFETYL